MLILILLTNGIPTARQVPTVRTWELEDAIEMCLDECDHYMGGNTEIDWCLGVSAQYTLFQMFMDDDTTQWSCRGDTVQSWQTSLTEMGAVCPEAAAMLQGYCTEIVTLQ